MTFLLWTVLSEMQYNRYFGPTLCISQAIFFFKFGCAVKSSLFDVHYISELYVYLHYKLYISMITWMWWQPTDQFVPCTTMFVCNIELDTHCTVEICPIVCTFEAFRNVGESEWCGVLLCLQWESVIARCIRKGMMISSYLRFCLLVCCLNPVIFLNPIFISFSFYGILPSLLIYYLNMPYSTTFLFHLSMKSVWLKIALISQNYILNNIW